MKKFLMGLCAAVLLFGCATTGGYQIPPTPSHCANMDMTGPDRMARGEVDDPTLKTYKEVDRYFAPDCTLFVFYNDVITNKCFVIVAVPMCVPGKCLHVPVAFISCEEARQLIDQIEHPEKYAPKRGDNNSVERDNDSAISNS